MASQDRFQHIDFVIFIEGEAFEEHPNEYHCGVALEAED
jgi:hypothetical protein